MAHTKKPSRTMLSCWQSGQRRNSMAAVNAEGCAMASRSSPLQHGADHLLDQPTRTIHRHTSGVRVGQKLVDRLR